MDVRRVVQVWARDVDGHDRVASGLLVTESVVLTATHALGAVRTGVDGVVVHSRAAGAGWSSHVQRVLDLGGDVSLAVCRTACPGPLGVQPPLGGLGTEARRVDAVAVGFPASAMQHRPVLSASLGQQTAAHDDAQADDDMNQDAADAYRRDTQFVGEIATGTGYADHSLTMHLAVRDHPSPPPLAQRSHSPFGGLSGAAMIVSGHIIGVVSEDPRPDHPTRLVGARLDHALMDVAARGGGLAGEVRDLLGIDLVGTLPDVTAEAGARAVSTAHREQARTIIDAIPGGVLKDRGAELAQMAKFSAVPGPDYLVWHALEWAGKTALMATFALEPPAGVDLITFFVNSNDADARSGDRYLASITAQLEGYLSEPPAATNLSVPAAAEGRCRDLLMRAARAATGNGRRLVLLVDALDEDLAYTPSSAGRTPIAALLPTQIPGLRVIASTRPYEHVMTAAPAHHPLRTTRARPLTISPHATSIKDDADREIRTATASGDPDQIVTQHILGYLVAAGHALTADDLASLINHSHRPAVTAQGVRTRLYSSLHRAVRLRRTGLDAVTVEPGAESFEWSHPTLAVSTRSYLGDELARQYAHELGVWAERQRRAGWTAATPTYLETGYPALLAANGDVDRLEQYALDAVRHGWLLTRRGGDDQALREVTDTATLLRAASPPDIARLVRLAFERNRLLGGNRYVPTALPALWVRLGQPRRGRALAQSMPVHASEEALVWVAGSLAATGHPREAESVARGITNTDRQAAALAVLAAALTEASNTTDAERVASDAERAARDIAEYNYLQADALIALAAAMAKAGNTTNAERVARSLAGTYWQADALAALAAALTEAGNTTDAERLASEAERLARSITDTYRQAEKLAAVAVAIAKAGNTTNAERMARSITDTDRRPGALAAGAGALAALAAALAKAGNTTDAERLASEAERVARSITDTDRQAEALTAVAAALAEAGNAGDAERLAGEAERVARDITEFTFRQADALTALAAALAKTGNTSDAERLAGEAERVARDTTDSDEQQRDALAALAAALTKVGNTTDAERVARSITDTYRQATKLAAVAVAMAEAGNTTDAERVARSIPGTDLQAGVLDMLAAALAEAGYTIDAERVARSITDTYRQETKLAAVAVAMAKVGNTTDAERVARSITEYTYLQADALAALVAAMAKAGNTTDAERVARSIPGTDLQAGVLATLATAMAKAGNTTDAERLAGDAERVAAASPTHTGRHTR